MTSADARLSEAVAQHVAALSLVRAEANATADHARKLAQSDHRTIPVMSRSVCVLDDEEGPRWALATTLREVLHVVVYEAATMRAADVVLARHHPAVVVCDWSLRRETPPRSGLEYLRTVPREHRAVIVSGHDALSSLTRECKTLNVRAFLRPLSVADTQALCDHVRALLDDVAPATGAP